MGLYCTAFVTSGVDLLREKSEGRSLIAGRWIEGNHLPVTGLLVLAGAVLIMLGTAWAFGGYLREWAPS